MKVCYFGIYDATYPRNKILMDGLRHNGVEVIECSSRAKGFKKFIELYKKHKKIKHKYDVMVVGFMGQLIMPFAKLLCRKKIVLDAFLSVYNSNVEDRQLYSKYSFRGMRDYFLDWFSVRLANEVLLDTNEHIKYFQKTFHVSTKKFHRIWIGADNTIFRNEELGMRNEEEFRVLWWGWMTPLHGIEYILEAAKIVRDKNIQFVFIGGGKQKKKALKMQKEWNLTNVEFREPLNAKELAHEINEADVCMGIFGKTKKAQMVIPNKIYEALACKKALITQDTPAVREVLSGREHCLFSKVGDGKDLSEKIMQLKNDVALNTAIAKKGNDLYSKNFTPDILGKELLKIL